MIEFYQKARELPPVPELEPMTRKPKILYVADTPNWTFHLEGQRYKKNLPEFDIDIGFVHHDSCRAQGRLQDYWLEKLKRCVYDVVAFMNVFNISEYAELKSFIANLNSRGTKVVLNINNRPTPEQLIEYLPRFKLFNAIAANTASICEQLAAHNISADFIPDSVDTDIFYPQTPWREREFTALFISSQLHLEHKGYKVWREVKELLKQRADIKFNELVVNSYSNKRTPEDMSKIYNQCKVFVCLSKSEGGPHTLLEAACCGCNIVSTNVGLASQFKDALLIPRDAQACVEKLMFLADNSSIAQQQASGILEDSKKFDAKERNKHWGRFIQKALKPNKELIEFYQHIPSLEPMPKKPSALLVADVSNWAYDIKCKGLKKALAKSFDIDIAYGNVEHCQKHDLVCSYWRNMVQCKHYDLVLFCHDYFIQDASDLKAYIEAANRLNTAVVVAINVVHSKAILTRDLPRFKLYNAVSSNNLEAYENLRSLGLSVSFTPDGVDREIYASRGSLSSRPFQALFVASKLHLEHKGYKLWQEVKNKLATRSDISFKEIVADSFNARDNVAEMVEAYNSSSVYVCLSESETGPRSLLEAISCGCNVISTRVGLARHLKNILHIERAAEDCANKLVLLKDNVDLALSMNDKVCKEIENYDIKKIANFWEHFMQKALRSPKLQ